MRVLEKMGYASPLGQRTKCYGCNALLMVDNESEVRLVTPPYSRETEKAWRFDCPLCKHEGYIEAKKEMQAC